MIAYLGASIGPEIPNIPDTITAASQSRLGIFALMIICLSLLAFAWFRKEKRNSKLVILLVFLIGAVAYAVAITEQKRVYTAEVAFQIASSDQGSAPNRLLIPDAKGFYMLPNGVQDKFGSLVLSAHLELPTKGMPPNGQPGYWGYLEAVIDPPESRWDLRGDVQRRSAIRRKNPRNV